jgi:VWFA-related protein
MFATLLPFACLLAHAGPARQPTGGPAWAGGQKPDQSEVSSHETPPTFQLRVERNVVVIRVVVRDSEGHALGNLSKDDFTLFDNGKPQIISGFSVERPGAPPVAVARAAKKEVKPPPVPEALSVPSTPQRFVALYFDDLHMGIEDVGRGLAAADRYLASAQGPQDRAAIFTSSGIGEVEFTDDLAKLHDALFLLRPRSKAEPVMSGTGPVMSDYQAYLITVVHDPRAIAIVMAEGGEGDARAPIDFMDIRERAAYWNPRAQETWDRADLQSTYSLDKLDQVVRRLAAMPGQRNLVLVSSGFLAMTHQPEVEKIIDRALHASVVINALDAQGLYAYLPGGGNPAAFVSTPGRPDLDAWKSEIEHQGLTVAREVMSTLAAATGGTFYTNSNDLDEGFRTVGALPGAYYVLTFSPQDLKADGKFHTLKVHVNSREPLTVQARRGYLAPGPPGGTGEKARRVASEIQNAIFSQEESHQLPAEVRTEYAKLNKQEATLTVFVHLDLRTLRFRKEQGRNLNVLTFATALFDKDGQYVTGNERVLEFRLKDETLAKLAQPGFTVGTKLKVRPGTYRLREVVRDSEAGQLSALNRPVTVTF